MQTQLHTQPSAWQQAAKQPWLGTCCNPARLSRRRNVSAGARRDMPRGRTEQTVTTVVVQPTELLRSDYARTQEKADVPLTVYSCRFSTGHGRGAGFQGHGAVNLCLIGKDGRSVLQRICPVNDPQTARQDISEMCQIIDDGVGADCPTALGQIPPPHSTPSAPSPSGYSLPPKPPPAPRMRFQEGTVDEVVFLAPELGPLSGILVGTESATWVLEELQIASSRTHHIDRFVCRRLLGSQPGQGAVFLQPVPPGAKLYGTGELQLMLTKEQAAALHTLNMEAYHDLKKRLLTTTALLTVSGAGMAGLAAGLEGALPFALGGLAGVVYQWLLQQSVDSIVATATPAPTPPSPAPRVNLQGSERPLATGTALDDPTVFIDFVEVDPDGTIVVQKKGAGPGGVGLPGRNLLGNPAVRIAFIAGLTALAISVMGGTMPERALGLPLLQRDQMWQLAVAVMGFLTYKIALISVSLSSPPPTDPQEATKVKTTSTGQNN